jgi:hypothetical protein
MRNRRWTPKQPSGWQPSLPQMVLALLVGCALPIGLLLLCGLLSR